jgi:hypothetical protein
MSLDIKKYIALNVTLKNILLQMSHTLFTESNTMFTLNQIVVYDSTSEGISYC